MNQLIEISKLVLNAGAFGLNVLIIILIYKLLDRWAPGLIKALRDGKNSDVSQKEGKKP